MITNKKNTFIEICPYLKMIFISILKTWYYYAAFIIYLFLIIFFLYRIELIDASNSKDIFCWSIVALVLSNKVTTYEISIKNIILNLFSYSIIIEYILNFYIFPLWIEFILNFLLLVFLSCIMFNKKDIIKNPSSSKKLTNNILSFIICIIVIIQIIFSILSIENNFNLQLVIVTIKNIFIPIIMTILYCPFMYFFRWFGIWQKERIRKKFNTKGN